MPSPHVLEGMKLGSFTLVLGEIRQLRLSGWKGFRLHLRDPQGRVSAVPVIEGIYSSGGKDGVRPWMDLVFRSDARPSGRAGGTAREPLGPGRLAERLFRCLGDTIPQGGHLMLSYEEELPPHVATMHSLAIGVPPVATPLGFLLFSAGFHLIKDWYLPEGGFEGPRKLWAEKAPDAPSARTLVERTAGQVSAFLSAASDPGHRRLLEPARARASAVLRLAENPPRP